MPKDKYAYKKLILYFPNPEVLVRLRRYTTREFGSHRAISMVCERAIDEYLKRKGA